MTDKGATVNTPGVKTKVDEESDEKLEPERATKYRRLVARRNDVAADGPDIQSAVTELAKFMANPTESAWLGLIRLSNFLELRPRMMIRFNYQGATRAIDT